MQKASDTFNMKDTFDFTLPEVAANTPTKPRLHVSDSTCVNCE